MDNKEYFLTLFNSLKEEELKRIGFRDNFIYITLVAIGTVFGFSLQDEHYRIALLVLPFFSVIMGWTYLCNDRKVSAIGNYISKYLEPGVITNSDIVTWADYRRGDKGRRTRKIVQLIVDIALFCISGIVSLIVFFIMTDNIGWPYVVLVVIEVTSIILLAGQFFKYVHD